MVGGEATTGTFGQVEAYDPIANLWTRHAPMPTPRHGLGAVALGGKLFVIAGGPTPGASASSANQIFSP
ncbi:Kelch motif protein [compost metagenome]